MKVNEPQLFDVNACCNIFIQHCLLIMLKYKTTCMGINYCVMNITGHE